MKIKLQNLVSITESNVGDIVALGYQAKKFIHQAMARLAVMVIARNLPQCITL